MAFALARSAALLGLQNRRKGFLGVAEVDWDVTDASVAHLDRQQASLGARVRCGAVLTGSVLKHVDAFESGGCRWCE
eukprot:7411265-Alexandrium_andersonii.AAC.1